MQIIFKNKKLSRICLEASKAEKEYGIKMAIKISMRIDEIKAASSVDYLVAHKIGRCHLLSGDRKGQYAMDLVHPKRLVFTVDKNGIIQIAEIIEIVDYH